MKKIAFSQLEAARRNPTAFAKALAESGASTARFSKYMAWQNSVFHYHKQRGDLAKAIKYFEATFVKNFADNSANRAERENWIKELEGYSIDEVRRRLTYVEHKKRVTIPINAELRLGGELPLIQMNTKGGYSVYFFSRDSSGWDQELKYPILQYHVARVLYNVRPDEVEIGVYSVADQRHLQHSFSRRDIRQAIQELDDLGSEIASAM